VNLKQWSIPVERTYAAPAGSNEPARSIRTERRVDLIEEQDRLHVHVDGRKVVHREHGESVTFAIGKYGCIIRRTVDDYELLVGGRRIDDMPSVFPVALHSQPPPPEASVDTGPIRLRVSPRILIALATLLVIVAAWKLRGHFSSPAGPPTFREIASTEGRFTASMPGEPATRVDTQTKDALTLTLNTTSAELDGRGVVGVVWADLPTNADGTLPIRESELTAMCTLAMNQLIVDAEKLVASPPDVQFTESGAVSEAGALGCRLGGTIKRAWRFSDLLSSNALYADQRLRLEVRGEVIGHRVYVRVAITEPNVPHVQRFFDGVRIER